LPEPFWAPITTLVITQYSALIASWRRFVGTALGAALGAVVASRFGPNVLLVPRTGAPWLIAFHRFADVLIGIVVALVLTVTWPEGERTPSEKI
jgi:uncharacterized membrane protein YgaE (UPF0421/DUF939 family)